MNAIAGGVLSISSEQETTLFFS